MSCRNCTGAIDQKKANDQKTVNEAYRLAKEEQKTFALYRDEQGNLCIIPAEESAGFPIVRYITSLV